MNDSGSRLRDSILEARDIARNADFITVSEDDRRHILEKAQTLLDKLYDVSRNYLVVGLLGGTGVGKSTLMNALAGASISSASHRRPHTDTILIYRHSDASLPFASDPAMVWKEFVHNSETVKQIILCDLPDYDSLLSEHRHQVIGFMEHADILVWLTSPEKYGDGGFYEFLRLVRKSERNFYFAVNKSDLFFDGPSFEEGFEKMQRVHADFQEHLRKTGIVNPVIYTLSAVEAFNKQILSPWNQFPGFRREIFRQRELKEIKGIKAANLEKEYYHYISLFEAELVHLESMRDILAGVITVVEEPDSGESFINEDISSIMDENIRSEIRSKIDNISLLKGPGYGVAALMRQWKYRSPRSRDKAAEGLFGFVTQRISQVFRRRRENLVNNIMSGIMRKSAHPAMAGQVRDILQSEYCTEIFEEKLERDTGDRLVSFHETGHAMFRAGQGIAYLFLLLALITALAGKGAWQSLFADPSLAQLLNFIITAFYNLFSPAGLAALGSYTLMNLLFGFWFYRRYLGLIERTTDEIIEAFVENVGALWRETVNHIAAALQEYDRMLEVTACSLRKLGKIDML